MYEPRAVKRIKIEKKATLIEEIEPLEFKKQLDSANMNF